MKYSSKTIKRNPALSPLRTLYRERHPKSRRVPQDRALILWSVRELKRATRVSEQNEKRLQRIRETFQKYAGTGAG